MANAPLSLNSVAHLHSNSVSTQLEVREFPLEHCAAAIVSGCIHGHKDGYPSWLVLCMSTTGQSTVQVGVETWCFSSHYLWDAVSFGVC